MDLGEQKRTVVTAPVALQQGESGKGCGTAQGARCTCMGACVQEGMRQTLSSNRKTEVSRHESATLGKVTS
jgi:hypothetical protein